MKLKLENGKHYTPKASDPVVCEDHNVTVRWGDLSPIQKLAVSEGIDVVGGRCILLPECSAPD
jgi:hypothetical protein